MGHLANMVDAAAEVGRKVSVGLALTAAASPLFPLPATAQQVAANTPRTTASAPAPDFSACDAMSQVNPKSAIACRVKVLDASAAAARQQGAAADVRVADANVLGRCLEYLKGQKAQGKPLPPISRENACAVATGMGMSPN